MAAPRVALVTGGTGALGTAIVRRMLADGALVAAPYVIDTERERLLAAVAAAERTRVEVERCDVTDGAAVDALVASLVARHGRIDVLVMAVGGFAGGRLVETDRATWDRMLAMNLTSAFVAARAVLPHMLAARSGRVVVIGSRAVVPPAAGVIAYTAAKAGVIALAQALAQEVKADGVTVNVVLPSTMDTPANRAAMPDVDPRTWVPVEAVADAIGFLVGPTAAHVNGTLLAI